MSEADRQFWLLVRRALIMVVKAIEVRYLSGQPCDVVDISIKIV